MMQKLPFLLILIVFNSFFGRAQQGAERITIAGVISAPEDLEVEGIHIYNTATQKGAVTSENGLFTLEVGKNDRLYISSLQFQDFKVIVDAEMIYSGKMKIYVNPNVNQLDEVLLKSHDLTGNMAVDAKQIKTHVIPNIQLSLPEILSQKNMESDRWSAIKGNASLEALGFSSNQGVSVDVVALYALLFPKKNIPIVPSIIEKINVLEVLKERFSIEFLNETYTIPTGKEIDFLYYLEDNGLLASYLKPENELKLLTFMQEQSVAYLLELEP
ncbi:hypothetical protein [Cochleicola gelatinilyticus]|uniref:TonB-dependent receptor n=1 Tax=Cochleicola gelatinilyticus TaxID=1763537 RepID=A0A167F3L7_9FLAO|nr:hypothetical protein [Cochleicola gelatinilyticus]OAB76157.1 hypothetical protein ULVI_13960 [Cochleicola gelatinilyticus]